MRYFRKKGVKYNNTKVEIDGHIFDSRKEANRYLELKLLERAGQIKDLELQKEFELIPNQYITQERYGKNGRRLKDKQILLEKKCVYRADFVYVDCETGMTIVEDTKSIATRTPEYIIKRKLMLYKYGIKIREV